LENGTEETKILKRCFTRRDGNIKRLIVVVSFNHVNQCFVSYPIFSRTLKAYPSGVFYDALPANVNGSMSDKGAGSFNRGSNYGRKKFIGKLLLRGNSPL